MLVNIENLAVDIDLIGVVRRRGQTGFALKGAGVFLREGLVRGLTRHLDARGYLCAGMNQNGHLRQAMVWILILHSAFYILHSSVRGSFGDSLAT